jgi:hypothetical protein
MPADDTPVPFVDQTGIKTMTSHLGHENLIKVTKKSPLPPFPTEAVSEFGMPISYLFIAMCFHRSYTSQKLWKAKFVVQINSYVTFNF